MLRPGQVLVLVVVSLLALGVLMVSSAGLSVGEEPLALRDVLFGRTAWLALAACASMVAASRIPIDRMWLARGSASPIPWLTAAIVAMLLAVHVPGIGHEVNGARRWVEIGPLGFQPSELAKWGLPFILAWHGARRAGSMGRFGPGFVTPIALVVLVCGLIATEDLGTALVIGAASIIILIAAGSRIWHALLLVPIAAAGFVGALAASPYRLDRLRAFADPYADPQGIGYHVLQSMATVSGGGYAGRGLGNGLQKFGYLPEDTTDFIFAVINEELGVAGAALVVWLYVGLLCAGLAIVLRTQHSFARLLGLGILVTIGLQALVNLLVVTGLAPAKGIALPLLSSGGTGWCLTAASVGVLLAIERSARRSEDDDRAARPALDASIAVGDAP